MEVLRSTLLPGVVVPPALAVYQSIGMFYTTKYLTNSFGVNGYELYSVLTEFLLT